MSRSRLKFIWSHDSTSGKTSQWSVVSKRNDEETFLGYISWRAQWRRYVFFPAYKTLFDASCMREVAEFIEQRMEERRGNN